MSQKYYNKIIEELIKKPRHVRELARKLGSNQTTISRTIKEMESKNIVDYETQGKNKVYFMKKTLEAYEYIITSEHIKLVEILQKYPKLRRTFDKIKKNKEIKLAILFGSYAKKIANNDSDIDIFVETKNKKIKQHIEKLNSKINVKIGNFEKNNLLIKEIIKNHIIIKGVERYYELLGFFEKN